MKKIPEHCILNVFVHSRNVTDILLINSKKYFANTENVHFIEYNLEQPFSFLQFTSIMNHVFLNTTLQTDSLELTLKKYFLRDFILVKQFKI